MALWGLSKSQMGCYLWIGREFPEISVPAKLNGSVRSNRKSFEITGPPFEVDHFFRSDRSEFWMNGSRPVMLA